MSADEDTELRDLVAQTLEANGTLGKLRAQLRASVFLALEEQESAQNRTPFLNKELNRFLATEDGRLLTSLVHEFLDYFHLDFTAAVFEPETGLSNSEELENRDSLVGELDLKDLPGQGPLLMEVLRGFRNSKSDHQQPSGSAKSTTFASVLTEKQVEDARNKFEEYDQDGSGAIDKDELRKLFVDMFPSFNKNMLERYVNDEFRAVDRDFSSSIDFDEFLGMYKRLFLQCRTVVSGDIEDLVSLSPKKKDTSTKNSAESLVAISAVEVKNQKNLEKSAPPLPRTPPPSKPHSDGGVASVDDILREDDPFFDDVIPSEDELHLFNNRERDKGLDKKDSASGCRGLGGDASTNGSGDGSMTGGGMSSLGDLSFYNAGSLSTTPNNKPAVAKSKGEQLRTLDRQLTEFNNENDILDDFEYEDDFQSSGHSLSQKSQRSKTEGRDKTENGSIDEEIEEEEIEDISIEADDLLKSENSRFDDITEDRSISQVDGFFDYMEDPQLP